jgi:hypothetical protein
MPVRVPLTPALAPANAGERGQHSLPLPLRGRGPG